MSAANGEPGAVGAEVPVVEVSQGPRFAGRLLRLMGMLGVGLGALQSLLLGVAIVAFFGDRDTAGALWCVRTALMGSGVVMMGSLMMAFGAMIGGKTGFREGKGFVWWVALLVGRNLGVITCAGVSMGVVGAVSAKEWVIAFACLILMFMLLKFSVRASLAKDRLEARWQAVQALQGLARLKEEEPLGERSR